MLAVVQCLNYSSTQAMLRYGETVSESLMQKASDEVAKNLLTNLFGEISKDDYSAGERLMKKVIISF